MKEKMRCRKGDMGCKKWEVRNMSFHAHIQFPKWNFDTKKLNWAPRNEKWDSNEDSRD